MTLDKSTLVRSYRMRLCKPHRTIGAHALNSLSTNRACHFDCSGPTLSTTFAPAKVSAYAVEKSLFDRPRQFQFHQYHKCYHLLISY